MVGFLDIGGEVETRIKQRYINVFMAMRTV